MEKNPIKFRLISTGRYVFAELGGKTIGPGITDLHFNAKDEKYQEAAAGTASLEK
jgi:hypothetical protein